MIFKFFSQVIAKWKALLSDRAYVFSLFFGVLVMFGAYFLTVVVSVYNDSSTYVSVGDLILDRLPTYNMEIVFNQGIYLTVLFIAGYVILFRPELMPFVLKSFGLLFFVRCGFIVLTKVGPPDGFFYSGGLHVSFDPLKGLIFKNDLFFSGHTSIPFMAFLLFKDDARVKWLMLSVSLLMGASVLLMHVHYSIDVFAAFFITHGIYSLSNKLFKDLNFRFKRRIYAISALSNIQKKFYEFRVPGKERFRGMEKEVYKERELKDR